MAEYYKRPPDKETDFYKIWILDHDQIPEAKGMLSIDFEKEKIFESRVYTLENGFVFKIISKINLKTNLISAIFKVLPPDGTQEVFKINRIKEREYYEMVECFERLLYQSPSKVVNKLVNNFADKSPEECMKELGVEM